MVIHELFNVKKEFIIFYILYSIFYENGYIYLFDVFHYIPYSMKMDI